MEIKKMTATKVIDAPAEKIFALLADPGKHDALDGGSMTKGPSEGSEGPIGGIGQVFTMNMHQDQLGDYRMVNTVTAFVPDARIGWGPQMDPDCEAAKNFEGVEVGGHTFTWDLVEGEGQTEVTETYDWTGVKDPQFEKLFPLVTQEQLDGSLDKLAEAATKS